MNKAELVDALAEHFGGNKAEATRALNAVLQTITFKTATEGRVAILGFGTFEKTVRPPRNVSDPGTGKTIRIKALATPVFRAGADFKAYVSGAKKVPRRRRTPPTRLTAAPISTTGPEALHPSASKRPLAKKSPAKKSPAKKSPAKKALPAEPPAATRPAADRTDPQPQPREE